TAENRDVVALEPDELVLEVDVPTPDASVYLKAMDRKKWSFPLVGVAAARFGDRVSYALSGVAPIPWSLSSPDELDRATPLPATALGLDPSRAQTNVLAGARYLRQLLVRFQSADLALAAYNAGPAAVDRSGGAPSGETMTYVANVTAAWRSLRGCT